MEVRRKENLLEKRMEEVRSKWGREEVKRWLCFIVRRAVACPYSDLEYELAFSSYKDKIYRSMANCIVGRSASACEFFTKKTMLQAKEKENGWLVDWAATKLSKEVDAATKKLLREYSAKFVQKSEYMQTIEEMSTLLLKEEKSA